MLVKVVTGVVSCVFAWQKNAYALVDAADPNGPGIFVGSNLPGMDRLELADGEAPTVGDLVEVRGVVLPYMLEPGVHASQIRIVGQRIVRLAGQPHVDETRTDIVVTRPCRQINHLRRRTAQYGQMRQRILIAHA